MAEVESRRRVKVLLVEDDRLIVEVLSDAFRGGSVALTHVESREAALEALEAGPAFDLVICDLKIPPSDTARDTDLAHGLAVIDHIRDACPGTPVVVFSNFGTLEVLGNRLARAPNEDIVGTDRRPMLEHMGKDKLDEFPESILRLSEEIASLHSDIEISWGGTPPVLSAHERRVLLIAARRHGAILVRSSALPGGRSGALTLRVDFERPTGELAGRLLAKLTAISELDDEKRRYDEFVAPFVPAGRYASLVETVRAGAGDRGALIYSLAGDYPLSLFERLDDSPAAAAEVVALIRAAEGPWLAAATASTTTVGELRAALIGDDAFAAERSRLAGAPIDEVEAQALHVRRCPGHGDMHGGNVLVDNRNDAVLIDYGRAGLAVAALDPVTLEVSAVLHPDAAIALGTWPSQEQAEGWFDLGRYIEDCPITPFVEKCRGWAHDVARGDREILAAAYAYAARQLQYPSVDRDLAAAYARGCLQKLAAS